MGGDLGKGANWLHSRPPFFFAQSFSALSFEGIGEEDLDLSRFCEALAGLRDEGEVDLPPPPKLCKKEGDKKRCLCR